MRYIVLLLIVTLMGCEANDREIVVKSTNRKERAYDSPPSYIPPAKVELPKVESTRHEEEEKKELPPEKAPPIPASFKPLNKDKTIFFEKKEDGTRLVHLLADVCLREGHLEVLVCKMHTKEHESILRLNADARDIHMALIAAGATPGKPVTYVPKYQPAKGTAIKITLTHMKGEKVVTVPASEWIRDIKTKKPLNIDWVFAGSKFFQDPEDPNTPPYYTANNGEVISLSNFPDSMLDLPVNSPKDVADLIFEINTAAVPPQLTPVIVTLQPVLEKKGK